MTETEDQAVSRSLEAGSLVINTEEDERRSLSAQAGEASRIALQKVCPQFVFVPVACSTHCLVLLKAKVQRKFMLL